MSISVPWGARVPGRPARRWLARARAAARRGRGAVAVAAFGGSGDRDAEWVTVYVASGVEQAHIIRAALLAEDIPAIVARQELPNLYGSALVWGVEVRVPRLLADRAAQVIEG